MKAAALVIAIVALSIGNVSAQPDWSYSSKEFADYIQYLRDNEILPSKPAPNEKLPEIKVDFQPDGTGIRYLDIVIPSGGHIKAMIDVIPAPGIKS